VVAWAPAALLELLEPVASRVGPLVRRGGSGLLAAAAAAAELSGAPPRGALAAVLLLCALVVVGLALAPVSLLLAGGMAPELGACRSAGAAWGSACAAVVPRAYPAGSSIHAWPGILPAAAADADGASRRSVGALVRRLEVEAARAIATSQRPSPEVAANGDGASRRRKKKKRRAGAASAKV